ncbi:MAG: type II toxin-antitoxin system YafQ family toxin [Fibrobacteraceae bacterium]|nr:type II toxin-antitoxin system YafQ family toxin [Fibrobacteraceae bacterium]
MTSAFKGDLKLLLKQHKNVNLLQDVVNTLLRGDVLESKYRDHALVGKWQGFRECHISPDWLLIYLKNENQLILTLTRTGSHSNLLKK